MMKKQINIYKIVMKPCGVIARYASFSPKKAIDDFLFDNKNWEYPERLKAVKEKVAGL